jgi:type I restriction enzyme M protein
MTFLANDGIGSQRRSKARAIVAEIDAEQALMAANRELITRFEQKIRATLARTGGEKKVEGGVGTMK